MSTTDFRASFVRATEGVTARDLCAILGCNKTEVYEWRAGTRQPGTLTKWAPRLDALLRALPQRTSEIRTLAAALRAVNIPDAETHAAMRRHFFAEPRA